MSDSHQKPWSDNPNAPIMPYDLYLYEKALFAGNLVNVIPYSTCRKPPPPSVRAHFVCPTYSRDCHRAVLQIHRRPVKWGLVAYIVAMFLLVTIGTALRLGTHSVSYIDNRGFPGVEGVLSPGPLGYQHFIDVVNPEAIAIIQNVVSNLNIG